MMTERHQGQALDCLGLGLYLLCQALARLAASPWQVWPGSYEHMHVSIAEFVWL